MSLVHELNTAEAEGVWVRNWQACATHAVKFRIEISLLRVEFLCGANLPYIREARQVQSVGLDIFDDGNYPLALEYYATDERKCMMLDIFNRCITVQARVRNADGELVRPEPVELPEVCQEEEEDDAANGNDDGDAGPPQAAFVACVGLADGAACSYEEDGDNIDGECGQPQGSDDLACLVP